MTDKVQVEVPEKTQIDLTFEPITSKKQDRIITASIIIGAILLVALVGLNL